MTDHCFTYGSLMCEDIMGAVCATAPLMPTPARLEGFRRAPVLGAEYPGMVPAAGGLVEGVLYLGLPATAWPRLDAFEGDEYCRSAVEVELPDGRRLTAWAYVFKPEYAARLGEGEWDFARFLETGKARFEALYMGFDTLGRES
jgi:gamma-glutamylcyclotransferase (GGCT)/AIG2-like uncharacterized protein YtfP